MKRAPIKADLSADYVRTLFDYDPLDGFLRHRARHGVVTGAIAGTIGNHGYVSVKIHQRSYLAHRVIWLIMKKEWNDIDIDHINGDKRDNRWGNLRSATRSENVANSGARSLHLKGAYPNRYGKWYSQIQDNGRIKYLGTFLTECDAHHAYMAAAIIVFGEYANSGVA